LQERYVYISFIMQYSAKILVPICVSSFLYNVKIITTLAKVRGGCRISDMQTDDLLPIVDTHSHVQFPIYDGDREAVIKRAQEAGVRMLAVGTQISTSKAGIRLANENPENIWATVGYHPNHLSDVWHHDEKEQSESNPERFDIKKLAELAADPKVVAIGECGLDYYRIKNLELGLPGQGIKERQKEVFLQQANLAQDLNKALMIHCRPSKGTDDAYEDLLDLLKVNSSKLRAVIHFYVGSPAITKKLVSAGFYFTFGGVVTFARDYDDSIKLISVERILLETDCPYVAPKSQRGKRNEPAFIRETAGAVAGLKGMEIDEFLGTVYKNSKEVFKI